ncbi:hypothetical protein FLGE108171_02150 [Flavobacterium gelidilacus]|uniref:hypothetical protein n=1 Tax=Flavobacterium gelidilacus TaxID=206041 RepID=UPI000409B98A|nr:hypothetical protein [Flavobacterium gelidilacus]
MARSNGLIKIEGTVEDLTFYQKNGKSFVRKKGGVSRERILNDPNYVRTRENMSEFSHSGSAGKILKLAVGSMAFKAKDSKLNSRLLQVMSRIKNLDSTSNRGKRLVSVGITTPEGKQLLKGFDFNINASLDSVLFAPYDLDLGSGSFKIVDFSTEEQLMYPQGATHVSFQSAIVDIDFASGDSVIAYSTIENLPLSFTPVTLTLSPSSVPSGLGVQFFLVLISFFQEINGLQYSLKNEEFNVLQIIEVV